MQKTEETVYYKVIRKWDRCSAIATHQDVKVHYPVGIWVYPQIVGSKLMVFENEIDAKDWQEGWISKGYPFIVVPCHVRKPKNTNLVKISDTYDINILTCVMQFWRRKKHFPKQFFQTSETGRFIIVSSKIPRGTVYASAVKCLA